MSKMPGEDKKTRLYHSTHVRNIQYPVTVRTQLGFFDKGATDIPHKIAESVATSVRIIDFALNRITPENYLNPNDSVAKIHYMVFRDEALRDACKTAQDQKADKEAREQARNAIAHAFRQRPPRSTSTEVGEVTFIVNELKKIRDGLTTPPLVIKVNNKKRKHSDHTPNIVGEDLPKYYRGMVKEWEELVKGTKVYGRGDIEIGYESFRTKLYIPRIIIHEGAHKYCKSQDGNHGYSGYWKSDYSDYLNPDMGILKRDNADSIAVFAWALAQNDIGMQVPGLFNSVVMSRWTR